MAILSASVEIVYIKGIFRRENDEYQAKIVIK
jgi:hypothetical protein